MTWFDAAQKIATGLAALVAAWVALQGLRAWRVQLHGKAEYELARRVLRAAFNVRDQIAQVRNPFVSIAETIQAYESAGVETEGIDVTRDTKRRDELVYQRRWQPLTNALSDLALEMLEAEVLWGQGVRKCETQLRKSVGELNAAVVLHLQDLHMTHRDPAKAAERMERNHDIVYGSNGDAFSRQVDSTIAEFESTFRPHLGIARRGRVGGAA